MDNYTRSHNQVSSPTAMKFYTDEVTYNKIQRHLTDINDVISEDDIRNVKIFSFPSTTEDQRLQQDALLPVKE